MTNCRFERRPGLWLLLAALLFLSSPARSLPLPAGLDALREAGDAQAAARAFLGIPYRRDGAVDENGFFTLFAAPGRRFSSPGLNCSGLVLGISRFLLRKNITLGEAARDRLGDSGPGAKLGEDWDFGWDLILNVSEGQPRALLLPGGLRADPAAGDGLSPRGFDIHEKGGLEELCGRLRPGFFYLVSLSAEGRRAGQSLSHYHVGLILPDAGGRAWLYQTTGRGKTSGRRDLCGPAGLDAFRRSFANTGVKRKMLLVLEVALPEADAAPD
ncbi:MAG: hypothetical protein LBU06_11855 [Desulfovibrio sp.]|nr:hypothetical protein [Desulfovibrio sp.]